MQPGGKREPSESKSEALARELEEELGCRIVPGSTRHLGTFEAPSANEPGQWVRAAIYAVAVTSPIEVRAEIAEYAWVDPQNPGNRPLAPLTRDVVLPLAVSLNEAAPAIR
jgi:8-oxo-dGTP diphosphatase